MRKALRNHSGILSSWTMILRRTSAQARDLIIELTSWLKQAESSLLVTRNIYTMKWRIFSSWTNLLVRENIRIHRSATHARTPGKNKPSYRIRIATSAENQHAKTASRRLDFSERRRMGQTMKGREDASASCVTESSWLKTWFMGHLTRLKYKTWSLRIRRRSKRHW